MMKHTILILIILCCFINVQAQKITRSYDNVSMSEALRDLNEQTHEYNISFLYNELEDFRVTTSIKHKTVTEAIMQIIGFYPIRVVKRGESEIFVECTHKTDLHLTGTIIDEQGQPVAYANVAILNPSDSTLLCGGVSNESGYFAVPYEQEQILVRISYVGYKTVYRLCDQPHIGTIRMQLETQRLKGVLVKGQVPVIRREAGTIVYDTRHVVGAINAADLFRYAPGIIINDGRISLLGTTGFVLCINGKDQRIGIEEMLQMLKSYPASDIERIEIVQSPDVSNSAEGHAGVINIVLKKRSNDYIGGSVGYARTQYEMHGDEINASVIYNRGKVSTSLNLGGIWDNTRYLENNEICFTENHRHGINKGQISKDNYSLRWQGDYRASDKLSLGTYVMYADGERSLAIDGIYDFRPKIVRSYSSFDTQTRRQENTKTWAVNANAGFINQESGVKVDFNFDYFRMSMKDASHSLSYETIIGNSLDDIVKSDTTNFDYENHITQAVDNYSAKVDVGYAGLRLGGQYAYTRSHLDLYYSGLGNYSYNQVSALYDERVLSGYLEYGRTFGKLWSVNLGGRYEHTWIKSDNRPIEYGSHTDYGKMFPSLHVGYNPDKSHAFNWSLGSRVTRPNIINLNPHRVWRDINNVSFGNRDLKPSYLYKAMMGYSFKSVLSLDLYYAYLPDRIDAVHSVEKAVTYTSWDNITDEHNLGINTIYSFDKLPWLTATLMQGVMYMKTIRNHKEKYQGLVSRYMYHQVRNVSYTGSLNASFFFDGNRRWVTNLNVTYSSPQKDVARSLNARYRVDIGMQYRLWNDQLKLGLTCCNLLASHMKGTEYLSTTTMDIDYKYDYRQFRLSLTYNWGARLRHSQRHYESDDMHERIVNDF